MESWSVLNVKSGNQLMTSTKTKMVCMEGLRFVKNVQISLQEKTTTKGLLAKIGLNKSSLDI
ncbi:hypothetical protein [Pseudomonas phage vB_PseuGesM_254]|uniref:Uncharacterized protein n=1 Tax=Pseudomonas phage vB_PseuGesM_254 TaxID=3092638 RepID=A0AAX4G769_9CAUD|nr:hypothetical protein [Pseudomonas phage PseuGes_254]